MAGFGCLVSNLILALLVSRLFFKMESPMMVGNFSESVVVKINLTIDNMYYHMM